MTDPSPSEISAAQTHSTAHEQVGAEYAKALLGVTEKTGNTETVVEELESLVADVLDKLPRLEASWSSPRVPTEAKLRMIDQAFSGRASRELINFLKVAARHGRLDCLRAIARHARDQLNTLRGKVRVVVRTAHPPSDELLGQIGDRLRQVLNSELDLKHEVDPDLVGGLVVRVGDTLYDGSVRNRLNRLRDQVVAQAAQQIRDSIERFAV